MAILPTVAFDNQLFIVAQKEAWSSSDGIYWSSRAKTDWGERHGMAYVFFDNKLWMMSGMRSWTEFKNDVWYSADGTNWKLAQPNARWSPRRNHSVVVFRDIIWLSGGAELTGKAGQSSGRNLNDVWSSTDGVNWTREKPSVEWPARDGQSILVFKNKLWMVGGTGQREVWSSIDGKKWTRETAQAPWSARQGNGALAFDDKLWILGGREMNDVWYSEDGKDWRKEFAAAPWSTRSANYSVVFKDKLWLYSGKTGREDSWSGDVWTLQSEGES